MEPKTCNNCVYKIQGKNVGDEFIQNIHENVYLCTKMNTEIKLHCYCSNWCRMERGIRDEQSNFNRKV